ncbi:hypothetical protein [Streptomyces sp. NPDC056227]|uniref:hypothetical protein n=1 Tax=Streptomyces sp. NPDC056227 TaxID=3345753 RepID=UPI0035DC5EA2
MLLLFPTREWQKRFDRNTRRRRKVPVGGYRTEHMDAPASEPAGPPAEPSSRMGLAAALYTASCTTCGGLALQARTDSAGAPVRVLAHIPFAP